MAEKGALAKIYTNLSLSCNSTRRARNSFRQLLILLCWYRVSHKGWDFRDDCTESYQPYFFNWWFCIALSCLHSFQSTSLKAHTEDKRLMLKIKEYFRSSLKSNTLWVTLYYQNWQNLKNTSATLKCNLFLNKNPNITEIFFFIKYVFI